MKLERHVLSGFWILSQVSCTYLIYNTQKKFMLFGWLHNIFKVCRLVMFFDDFFKIVSSLVEVPTRNILG